MVARSAAEEFEQIELNDGGFTVTNLIATGSFTREFVEGGEHGGGHGSNSTDAAIAFTAGVGVTLGIAASSFLGAPLSNRSASPGWFVLPLLCRSFVVFLLPGTSEMWPNSPDVYQEGLAW